VKETLPAQHKAAIAVNGRTGRAITVNKRPVNASRMDKAKPRLETILEAAIAAGTILSSKQTTIHRASQPIRRNPGRRNRHKTVATPTAAEARMAERAAAEMVCGDSPNSWAVATELWTMAGRSLEMVL
jgi:hypothetical protein